MSTQAPAELILFNGRVLTMDPLKPLASMVAVRGERVVGVGEDETPWLGPGTRMVNCGRKIVLPGFNDAHCHILAFVQSLLSLDFSPAKVASIAEMKAALRQRAERVPPGSWITATGYNEFYLSEKRHPTRWDLNEAAPRNPVRLLHRSGHAQVLNSLGLAQVGITVETEEPPGALIDRDLESGEPNGLLFEMNNHVAQKMPLLGREELEQGIGLANRTYLTLGITSLQDASVRNDPTQWRLFQGLKQSGELAPRVTMMLGHVSLDDFLSEGLLPGSGDYHLRLGAVKVVLDESTGSLYPSQPELDELVMRVHEAGYQMAIHAIDTVDAAATALERALAKYPRPHRHRIEHCSVCPPATLERLSKLGAIVVTQPPFLYYSGERYLSEVPKAQLPWLYRIASFREAGLQPAASSDSPVVPNNPLIGIYAAATRKAENGAALLSEEAVSPDEGVEMYTSAAAYASYEETEKGAIAPGKLADLVVLDRDPTAIPLEEIKYVKVEMTMIGGRVMWGGV